MRFVLRPLLATFLRNLLKGFGHSSGEVKETKDTICCKDCHFDESVLEEMWARESGGLPPVVLVCVHLASLSVHLPDKDKGLEVHLDGLSVVVRRRDAASTSIERLRKMREYHIRKLSRPRAEMLAA